MTRARTVVGCMSGTSMDGIDAALVAIEGTGLAMQARLVRAASGPLPRADELRAFADGAALSAHEIRLVARDLGEAHRAVIEGLLGDETPDLIVMHGQTVLHAPPLSWQVVDPWPVASRFGCRVVSDLRSRSIAGGGQGAPLTPLADWVLFRDADETRTVVNLGGFANFTRLPAASGDPDSDVARIEGGDICPCNLVLDRIARERLSKAYDDGGQTALAGTVSAGLAEKLAERFASASDRSLGTGDEALWIDEVTASLSPGDALATVCDAIARAIAVRTGSGLLVLAGGGAHNQALVRAIERHHRGRVRTSDALGVPVQYREAIAFAVLGALADDGVPTSLPQITGAATSGRDGQWILP